MVIPYRLSETDTPWESLSDQILVPPIIDAVSAIALLDVASSKIDNALSNAQRELKRKNANGASGAISVAATVIANTEALLKNIPQEIPGPDPAWAQPLEAQSVRASSLPDQCQELANQILVMESHRQPTTQAAEWYANQYFAIANERAFNVAKKNFSDQSNPLILQGAYLSAAEYLSQHLAFSTMDPDATAKVADEPDSMGDHKTRVRAAALRANEAITTQLAAMIRRFNRIIPLQISPILETNREQMEVMIPDKMSTIKADIGFYMGDPNADPAIHRPPAIIVCFIHQATKHIKMLTEPYPAGYPRTSALDHIHEARSKLQPATVVLSQQVKHPAILIQQAFHKMGITETIDQTEAIILLGLHDLSAEFGTDLINADHPALLDHGTRNIVINAIADHNPEAAEHIRSATGHNPIFPRPAAEAIIQTARNHQLSDHTLALLATQLGYNPRDLDVPLTPLPADQTRTLTQLAQGLALPPDAVKRISQAATQPTHRSFLPIPDKNQWRKTDD